MAPKKGRETPLELCQRATTLGNSVAIHMLEYLGTVKNQTYTVRGLANVFFEISQILWSIEAGLKEASRTNNPIPSDMLTELDQKFRKTYDDFTVVNQMMSKFLDSEKKGGFRRGWRMMFADSDIEKIKESLSKTRDALKMSSVMFRWSLGSIKADASVGIGYTALAAALKRMNQDSPSEVMPMAMPSTPQPAVQPVVSEPPTSLPPLPPVTLAERGSNTNLNMRSIEPARHDDILHALSTDLDQMVRHAPPRSPSASTRYSTMSPTRSSNSTTPTSVSTNLTTPSIYQKQKSPPVTTRDFPMPPNAEEQVVEDNMSLRTTTSMAQIEDMIQDVEINDKSGQNARHRADPSTVPRWTPKQTSGAQSPALKSALVNAVQHQNHKTVEQLLDCGVPPDNNLDLNLLNVAIQNQDLDTVRLLLLFGANPNGVDKNTITPLYHATRTSLTDAAKMLIKYGADANLAAGPDDESPLAKAVADNNAELSQLYLTYGGEADFILPDGSTVLVRAMNKSTQLRMLELLLKYGANPNQKDNMGRTALFEAIQARRLDFVSLLLDHGADPNLPGPKHPLWPSTYQPKVLELMLAHGAQHKKCPGVLELAASLNNRESASILLEAGVDPNIRKDGVYTPLCTAIRDDRIELVSLLLANGADPNVMASEYPAFKCVTHHRTHLLPQLVAAGADLQHPKGIVETAVSHNNKDSLMFLLDHGVNPNDRSPEGRTALTTAIRENRVEFVDILLEHGADPAVRGEDWPICMAVKQPAILQKLLAHITSPRSIKKGVMEMAVVADQLESIKLLLKAGVSVEDRNGGVFSPLTTAIREYRKNIVRYLIDEAGADINSPGEHLPIIKAIRRCLPGDYEVIELLLARGADINLVYRGWNAVLQAVENADASILRILAEKGNGVDLNVTDESGRTVLEIVQERGWDEGLSILLGEEVQPEH